MVFGHNSKTYAARDVLSLMSGLVVPLLISLLSFFMKVQFDEIKGSIKEGILEDKHLEERITSTKEQMTQRIESLAQLESTHYTEVKVGCCIK